MTELDIFLDKYPVVIELPVLWGHMDALQHVNNVAYFRYAESARVAWVERVGILEILKETNIGPMLVATECRFLKALRYPDTIKVGHFTTRLSLSEIDHQYAIYSQQLEKIAAIGTSKMVAIDFKISKKTIFPGVMINQILEFEKGLCLSEE